MEHDQVVHAHAIAVRVQQMPTRLRSILPKITKAVQSIKIGQIEPYWAGRAKCRGRQTISRLDIWPAHCVFDTLAPALAH